MRTKLATLSVAIIFSVPIIASASTVEQMQSILQSLRDILTSLQTQSITATAVTAGTRDLQDKPSYVASSTGVSTIIPGKYIVTLKKAATARSVTDFVTGSNATGKSLSKNTRQRFSKALNGFSATLSSDEVNALKNDASVESIVPDRAMFISDAAQVIPTGVQRINATAAANKGQGVNVAVLDTGIDLQHPDLAAHIVGGTSCVPGSQTYNDANGHGTHVAGIIGALDNDVGVVGVAPETRLWAVKVMGDDGSGSWSSIICGIEFVIANAVGNGGPISVVNMSLGGDGTSDNNCGATNDDPLHAAICRMRDAGVTVVVAAGNNRRDASLEVPAAYDDAVITVSALNDTDGLPGGLGAGDDKFAIFSNYGPVVDLGAPGNNIYSTYLHTSANPYFSLSGTSMAAPHVAGAVAIYLADHPGASWSAVRNALVVAGERPGSTTHSATSSQGVLLYPEPVVLVRPQQNLQSTQLSITAPNGGESVEANIPYTITWKGSFLDNTKVMLVKDGVVVKTLADNRPPLRELSWTPDSSDVSATANYKIRVQAKTYDRGVVEDESDNSFKIVVVGRATVSADKGQYTAGDGITATWNASAPNAQDWIAIAPNEGTYAGVTYASNNAWTYTAGAINGSKRLIAPNVNGTYQLVYYQNNGTSVLARSAPFTISPGAEVSTDKTQYYSGEPIAVSWMRTRNLYPKDWVAIAPENGSYAGVAYANATTWAYTNGGPGGMRQLIAPNVDGLYQAVYYQNDQTIELGRSAVFRISPAPVIRFDKQTYSPGETISVTWNKNAPVYQYDWVGMHKSNSVFGDLPSKENGTWFYTGGSLTGTKTLVAPSAPGTYQLGYYVNNGSTEAYKSATFTVGTSSALGVIESDTSDTGKYVASGNIQNAQIANVLTSLEQILQRVIAILN